MWPRPVGLLALLAAAAAASSDANSPALQPADFGWQEGWAGKRDAAAVIRSAGETLAAMSADKGAVLPSTREDPIPCTESPCTTHRESVPHEAPHEAPAAVRAMPAPQPPHSSEPPTWAHSHEAFDAERAARDAHAALAAHEAPAPRPAAVLPRASPVAALRRTLRGAAAAAVRLPRRGLELLGDDNGAPASLCLSRTLYNETLGFGSAYEGMTGGDVVGTVASSVVLLAALAFVSTLLLLFGEYMVKPGIFIMGFLVAFLFVFQGLYFIIDSEAPWFGMEECYVPLIFATVVGLTLGFVSLFFLSFAVFLLGAAIGIVIAFQGKNLAIAINPANAVSPLLPYFWLGALGAGLLFGLLAQCCRRNIFAIGTSMIGALGFSIALRSTVVLAGGKLPEWGEMTIFACLALGGWLFQVFYMRARSPTGGAPASASLSSTGKKPLLGESKSALDREESAATPSAIPAKSSGGYW